MQFNPAIARGFVCLAVHLWPHILGRYTEPIERCRPIPAGRGVVVGCHFALVMGEAKIDTGEGSIFNMTPSPGGTSCLENAEIDM